MKRYHVRENGDVGLCSAKPGACPLGDFDHYTDLVKAHKAAEGLMTFMHGALPEPERKSHDVMVEALNTKMMDRGFDHWETAFQVEEEEEERLLRLMNESYEERYRREVREKQAKAESDERYSVERQVLPVFEVYGAEKVYGPEARRKTEAIARNLAPGKGANAATPRYVPGPLPDIEGKITLRRRVKARLTTNYAKKLDTFDEKHNASDPLSRKRARLSVARAFAWWTAKKAATKGTAGAAKAFFKD